MAEMDCCDDELRNRMLDFNKFCNFWKQSFGVIKTRHERSDPALEVDWISRVSQIPASACSQAVPVNIQDIRVVFRVLGLCEKVPKMPAPAPPFRAETG